MYHTRKVFDKYDVLITNFILDLARLVPLQAESGNIPTIEERVSKLLEIYETRKQV